MRMQLLHDYLLEEPNGFDFILRVLANHALAGTDGRSAICNEHWMKIHSAIVKVQALSEDFPHD